MSKAPGPVFLPSGRKRRDNLFWLILWAVVAVAGLVWNETKEGGLLSGFW